MAVISKQTLFVFFFSILFLFHSSMATPRKLVLVPTPSTTLNYHNGPLLKGTYTVNLLYYGRFSPPQVAIISDFLLSLSSPGSPPPSVSSWWATTSRYNSGATKLTLGKQTTDDSYSLGKSLKTSDIINLLLTTNTTAGPTSIAVLLTSADVTVEQFCSARCGTHGSLPAGPAPAAAGTYVWVGNPSDQCPGQCAWPFHQPAYGPQAPPLVSPNGDVGADGMVISLAAALAGAATNPFGTGFYQGPASAPLEAVSACAGMFGSGSYPGYPGRVRVDSAGGGSYNAVGVGGRSYLLPAMWDPKTSQCSTLL
ncbi:putative protein EXORDIUM-like 2 [Iris pallida]|uniref:Uncharacterized protein n=1 Tax=Iris pallida TaxID=29817 RepID=A0AAX6HGV6_IRIPA|nr:putative protein EXORDIUM-like 2 [Iris pallida]